jgi:hypothetical protein
MSDDFKSVDKKEQHTQKNPSLVGATFIKYFFIAAITIIILYFLASYVLPMFGRGGETPSGSGGTVDVEIDVSGEGE